MEDLQKLIGKVVSDENFANTLAADPEKALRDAGVEPTPEILDALSDLDTEAIKKLAASFGKSKAAH